MPLRPSQVETLRLIGELPIAVACGGSTEYTRDQINVNWQTAEAFERRGLIEITREIDGDGHKAWDLSLTQLGREALEGKQ